MPDNAEQRAVRQMAHRVVEAALQTHYGRENVRSYPQGFTVKVKQPDRNPVYVEVQIKLPI